jgi:ASC-1-like (ASCH) protein
MCCLPSALAAAISCPAEVTLVRISNDAQLAPEKRRNYKGVVDAFQRILREEGVKTFFSGCGPFVNRAMMVGAVQVGTYDQFREMYKDMGVKHELLNVFYASMTSGLIYAIATMPFETAKNRMAFQVRLLVQQTARMTTVTPRPILRSTETRPGDEGAPLPQCHADHNDDRQDRRRAHSLERLPAVLHSLRRPHGADVHVRGVAEKAVPEDAGGIKGLPVRGVHVVCSQQC